MSDYGDRLDWADDDPMPTLDPSGPVGPGPAGQLFYGPTILSGGRARFGLVDSDIDGSFIDRWTGLSVVELDPVASYDRTGRPTDDWWVTVDGRPMIGRWSADGRAIGFEPVDVEPVPVDLRHTDYCDRTNRASWVGCICM